MDALKQGLVSTKEFLSWVGSQEGRFELVGGWIFMMAGATEAHNVVVNNVTVALTPLAKKNGCRSSTNNTAVQTANGNVRYPDVIIDCGPPNAKSLTASNPTIVVEVSSQSTSQVDATVKLDEYKNVPSIMMIVQVEPDRLLVGVHRRIGETSWHTEVYEALEDVIDLPPIAGKLSLQEVYDTLSVTSRPRIKIVRDEDA